MNPNFYLLLCIFDPEDDWVGTADNDATIMARLTKAIQNRDLQLSKQLANPRTKSRAALEQSMLKKALPALSTCQTRRAQWEDAANQVFKHIADTMAIFKTRGYVSTAELKLAVDAVKKKWSLTISDEVVAHVITERLPGLEVREQGAAAAAAAQLLEPVSYVQQKANIELLANTYGLAGFYEFLGADHGVESKIIAIPTQQWLAWADEKNKGLPNKAETWVSDFKKLANAAKKVFASDAARHEYDQCLVYYQQRTLLDEMVHSFGISRELDEVSAKKLVADLMQTAARYGHKLDAATAEEYVLAACAQAGIRCALGAGAAASAPAAAAETCPGCGSFITAGDQVCTRCGSRIYIPCPQCGTENRADVGYCAHCSHDYSQLRKALLLCDQAQADIERLALADAAARLAQVQVLWPGLTEAERAQAAWEKQQQLFGTLSDELTKAVASREFIQAQATIEKIQQQIPDFSSPEITAKITQAIADAQDLLNASSGTITAANCLELWKICADYPGVSTFFAQQRPAQVANLQVFPDGVSRENTISWQEQAQPEIRFVVRRKVGTPFAHENDGEILGETMGALFVDEHVPAGEAVYYAVVSQYGPVVSPFATVGPVENLFEISGLQVSTLENSVKASWAVLPRNTKVVVYRQQGAVPQPGQGTVVANAFDAGMHDKNLQPDCEYGYRVCVGYPTASGDVRLSSGITFTASPTAPLQEVSFLNATLLEGCRFSIEWELPAQGQVQFVYTTALSNYAAGTEFAVDQLATVGMPLPVQETSAGTGFFELPDEQTYYVYALTVQGHKAVVGANVAVCAKKIIAIRKLYVSANSIVIDFPWPPEASQVLVTWRTDRFPNRPGEPGISTKAINQQLHAQNDAVIINGVDLHADYYFSLFARIGSGDSASYSAPTTQLLRLNAGSKVTYRVEASFSLLGKLKSAQLTLMSDKPIPAWQLRADSRKVPVYADDGIQIATGPVLQGQTSYTIPLPPQLLKKGQYVRLFFADETAYQLADLVHPSNAQLG